MRSITAVLATLLLGLLLMGLLGLSAGCSGGSAAASNSGARANFNLGSF